MIFLDKITKLIRKCRYGIHDISRIELNINGYPRFNMPFELGIFFGASKFGNNTQKKKVALVFEETKYSYQQIISDLNGIDTKAHSSNTEKLIRELRNWIKIQKPNQEIFQFVVQIMVLFQRFFNTFSILFQVLTAQLFVKYLVREQLALILLLAKKSLWCSSLFALT